MELSKIKNLFAFEDGDCITPGMGVQIAAGFGLQQYYDPNTGNVSQTDFTQHPAILYPQPYSSKLGSIVVLSSVQWYYNNITDNNGILDSNGNIKSSFSSIFEVTSVTQNGKTFPALKIKGNLVSSSNQDFSDKRIYCVGTYRGSQVTCSQVIPVQSSVGDAYSVLVSCTGQDGVGDNVLSDDNDWILFTAYLQLAGNPVTGVSFVFQRLVNGVWTNIVNTSGVTEVGSNTLKVFDAAVEGVELYRAAATYGGKTYYKVFEATDIHDPYILDDGCNIVGDTIKNGEVATFSPKVYDRSTGDQVTGFTFSYTLVKMSDSSVISDVTVNNLTYDNISNKGGISVRIQATRND